MSSKTMPDELNQLLKEKIQRCFQCGTCVGGCPVARVINDYNPRRIMEDLMLGEWKEVLSGDLIWLCSNCHTCFERCPQRVGLSHIFVELRNLAVKMGKAPDDFIKNVTHLANTGRISVLSPAVERRRAELNLPRIPPVSVDEIRKIIKLMGPEALLLKETKEG